MDLAAREQTENGELGIEARIGETLRQQGWRPVPGAGHDRSESGVLRIPIERIPTNDDSE